MRKKSLVWEHFTVETFGAGCTRACCKQCKQTFAYIRGSKLSGTSHLKRHISSGKCLANHWKERDQLASNKPSDYRTDGFRTTTDLPRRRQEGFSFSADFPFDQELCRHEMTKMIIMHEYPLDMVEHPAFVSFVWNLQPEFNMVNSETVQEDCLAIYLKEKQKLGEFLGGIPGRVSLSVDLLTSSQTLGYVFLTGHFIDSVWKLQRRILNVVMVPSPSSTDALTHAVGICSSDWGLESKLFSITMDKHILSNEVRSLRGFLSTNNQFILNLLSEHCYAHVLTSIAQDVLHMTKETIDKVRESVKYLNLSKSDEKKVLKLKHEQQVPSRMHLTLDDQKQWNTTYLMLVAAVELKEVFSCLDAADPDYKLVPSLDDWKRIETVCTYLKLLYDAANVFSGMTYPTADVYFHQVWKIQLELANAAASQDPFISKLTQPLREKFDVYWRNCSLILATAVFFDPRFKMKIVEFSFSKIYGDNASMYIKLVEEGIHELFTEYNFQLLQVTPAYIEWESLGNVKTEAKPQLPLEATLLSTDQPSDFSIFMSEMPILQHTQSELEQYLEESALPHTLEFDILSWWKLNNAKYPTLSKIASDILAIPVCTVQPEAVFNTGGRELNSHWSSLRPEMVEALICAKDWLHYGSAETKNELVKMEISIL